MGNGVDFSQVVFCLREGGGKGRPQFRNKNKTPNFFPRIVDNVWIGFFFLLTISGGGDELEIVTINVMGGRHH